MIMDIEQHMHIPDAMEAPDSSVSRGVFLIIHFEDSFYRGWGEKLQHSGSRYRN